MAMKLCAGHFYGLTTGALRVSGFTFSEIAYEARFNIPKHSHELPIFCFVLTGSYTERFGRVQAERSPSTLIFHPSASEHTEDYPIKGRHFLIEVESQHFECIQNVGGLRVAKGH